MKIGIISDVHLEFGRGKLEIPECDLLVLAGDIFLPVTHSKKNLNMKLEKRNKKFFDECSEKAKQTIMVLGNHEHYHMCFYDTAEKVRDWISPYSNIILLDNSSTTFDDLCIFGATMWTDFNNGNPLAMMDAYALSDYSQIRKSNYSEYPVEFITPDFIYRKNQYTMNQLKFFLDENVGKQTMIVTHHAPSWLCVDDVYKTDTVSYAYANVSLDNFLAYDNGPDYWIHGHMHKTHDFMHGKTRIICNARGYFGEEPRAKVTQPIIIER